MGRFPARTLAIIATTLMTAAIAKPLELIVFPGGANWPLWVAQEKGFYAKHGVDVKVTPTPNSVFLVQNLVAGKFDIAFSTFDNAVAYDEGQGEAPLDRPADLVAVMGGLSGGLRLLAHPDVHSIAELKGKRIAVDAANTGYALALRELLKRGGLSPADYELERVGGTGQRAQALMENRTIATIVTSPLDLLPLSKGYRLLANFSEAVGPYQATLYMVRRPWAQAHEAELVGFMRAMLEANAWLADRANRDEAVALYRKHIPQASETAAQKAWDALLGGGKEGLQVDGRIDMEGAANVLRIRSEFGEPRKDLKDPSKYIDESYHRKAVAATVSSGRP
ncbi:MAG: ABC transporter substrate-binding protein [Betaproteobacteria bacterium]